MRLAVVAGAMLLGACGSTAPSPNQPAAAAKADKAGTAVKLTAADGLSVYATYYRAARPKALILLFHQAGSSSGEYATIAPKLVAAGYSALAVDLRSGGDMYGANRTAGQLRGDPGYLAAQKDMQAAVDWAAAIGPPVIVWGSSYSSALAFPVAAANPSVVTAVLAFSPGEYFDDKTLVERAAAKLRVPVFVTVASGNGEATTAKPIVDALGGDKVFYVPDTGVHGSSTLIEAKDPQGAAANWRAVMAFLRRIER